MASSGVGACFFSEKNLSKRLGFECKVSYHSESRVLCLDHKELDCKDEFGKNIANDVDLSHVQLSSISAVFISRELRTKLYEVFEHQKLPSRIKRAERGVLSCMSADWKQERMGWSITIALYAYLIACRARFNWESFHIRLGQEAIRAVINNLKGIVGMKDADRWLSIERVIFGCASDIDASDYSSMIEANYFHFLRSSLPLSLTLESDTSIMEEFVRMSLTDIRDDTLAIGEARYRMHLMTCDQTFIHRKRALMHSSGAMNPWSIAVTETEQFLFDEITRGIIKTLKIKVVEESQSVMVSGMNIIDVSSGNHTRKIDRLIRAANSSKALWMYKKTDESSEEFSPELRDLLDKVVNQEGIDIPWTQEILNQALSEASRVKTLNRQVSRHGLTIRNCTNTLRLMFDSKRMMMDDLKVSSHSNYLLERLENICASIESKSEEGLSQFLTDFRYEINQFIKLHKHNESYKPVLCEMETALGILELQAPPASYCSRLMVLIQGHAAECFLGSLLEKPFEDESSKKDMRGILEEKFDEDKVSEWFKFCPDSLTVKPDFYEWQNDSELTIWEVGWTKKTDEKEKADTAKYRNAALVLKKNKIILNLKTVSLGWNFQAWQRMSAMYKKEFDPFVQELANFLANSRRSLYKVADIVKTEEQFLIMHNVEVKFVRRYLTSSVSSSKLMAKKAWAMRRLVKEFPEIQQIPEKSVFFETWLTHPNPINEILRGRKKTKKLLQQDVRKHYMLAGIQNQPDELQRGGSDRAGSCASSDEDSDNDSVITVREVGGRETTLGDGSDGDSFIQPQSDSGPHHQDEACDESAGDVDQTARDLFLGTEKEEGFFEVLNKVFEDDCKLERSGRDAAKKVVRSWDKKDDRASEYTPHTDSIMQVPGLGDVNKKKFLKTKFATSKTTFLDVMKDMSVFNRLMSSVSFPVRLRGEIKASRIKEFKSMTSRLADLESKKCSAKFTLRRGGKIVSLKSPNAEVVKKKLFSESFYKEYMKYLKSGLDHTDKKLDWFFEMAQCKDTCKVELECLFRTEEPNAPLPASGYSDKLESLEDKISEPMAKLVSALVELDPMWNKTAEERRKTLLDRKLNRCDRSQRGEMFKPSRERLRLYKTTCDDLLDDAEESANLFARLFDPEVVNTFMKEPPTRLCISEIEKVYSKLSSMKVGLELLLVHDVGDAYLKAMSQSLAAGRLFTINLKNFDAQLIISFTGSPSETDSHKCVLSSDHSVFTSLFLARQNDQASEDAEDVNTKKLSHCFNMTEKLARHYEALPSTLCSMLLLLLQYERELSPGQPLSARAEKIIDDTIKNSFFFFLKNSKASNELIQNYRYIVMALCNDFVFSKELGEKLSVATRSTVEYVMKERMKKTTLDWGSFHDAHKDELQEMLNSSVEEERFPSLLMDDQQFRSLKSVFVEIYLCHLYNKDGGSRDAMSVAVMNKSLKNQISTEIRLNGSQLDFDVMVGNDYNKTKDEFIEHCHECLMETGPVCSFSGSMVHQSGKMLSEKLNSKGFSTRSVNINVGISSNSKTTSIIKKKVEQINLDKCVLAAKTKKLIRVSRLLNDDSKHETKEEKMKKILSVRSGEDKAELDIVKKIVKDSPNAAMSVETLSGCYTSALNDTETSRFCDIKTAKWLNSKLNCMGMNESKVKSSRLFSTQLGGDSLMESLLKDSKTSQISETDAKYCAKKLVDSLNRSWSTGTPSAEEQYWLERVNESVMHFDHVSPSSRLRVLNLEKELHELRNEQSREEAVNFFEEMQPVASELTGVIMDHYCHYKVLIMTVFAMVSLRKMDFEGADGLEGDHDMVINNEILIRKVMSSLTHGLSDQLLSLRLNLFCKFVQNNSLQYAWLSGMMKPEGSRKAKELEMLREQSISLFVSEDPGDRILDLIMYDHFMRLKNERVSTLMSGRGTSNRGLWELKTSARSKVVLELLDQCMNRLTQSNQFSTSIQSVAEELVTREDSDYFGVAPKEQFGGNRELGIQDFETMITQFVVETIFTNINKQINDPTLVEGLSHVNGKLYMVKDAVETVKKFQRLKLESICSPVERSVVTEFVTRAIEEDLGDSLSDWTRKADPQKVNRIASFLLNLRSNHRQDKDINCAVACVVMNIDHAKWGPKHAPSLNFKCFMEGMRDSLIEFWNFLDAKFSGNCVKRVEINKATITRIVDFLRDNGDLTPDEIKMKLTDNQNIILRQLRLGKPYITKICDMIQGIYHHTSSSYAMACELLKQNLKRKSSEQQGWSIYESSIQGSDDKLNYTFAIKSDYSAVRDEEELGQSVKKLKFISEFYDQHRIHDPSNHNNLKSLILKLSQELDVEDATDGASDSDNEDAAESDVEAEWDPVSEWMVAVERKHKKMRDFSKNLVDRLEKIMVETDFCSTNQQNPMEYVRTSILTERTVASLQNMLTSPKSTYGTQIYEYNSHFSTTHVSTSPCLKFCSTQMMFYKCSDMKEMNCSLYSACLQGLQNGVPLVNLTLMCLKTQSSYRELGLFNVGGRNNPATQGVTDLRGLPFCLGGLWIPTHSEILLNSTALIEAENVLKYCPESLRSAVFKGFLDFSSTTTKTAGEHVDSFFNVDKKKLELNAVRKAKDDLRSCRSRIENARGPTNMRDCAEDYLLGTSLPLTTRSDLCRFGRILSSEKIANSMADISVSGHMRLFASLYRGSYFISTFCDDDRGTKGLVSYSERFTESLLEHEGEDSNEEESALDLLVKKRKENENGNLDKLRKKEASVTGEHAMDLGEDHTWVKFPYNSPVKKLSTDVKTIMKFLVAGEEQRIHVGEYVDLFTLDEDLSLAQQVAGKEIAQMLDLINQNEMDKQDELISLMMRVETILSSYKSRHFLLFGPGDSMEAKESHIVNLLTRNTIHGVYLESNSSQDLKFTDQDRQFVEAVEEMLSLVYSVIEPRFRSRFIEKLGNQARVIGGCQTSIKSKLRSLVAACSEFEKSRKLRLNCLMAALDDSDAIESLHSLAKLRAPMQVSSRKGGRLIITTIKGDHVIRTEVFKDASITTTNMLPQNNKPNNKVTSLIESHLLGISNFVTRYLNTLKIEESLFKSMPDDDLKDSAETYYAVCEAKKKSEFCKFQSTDGMTLQLVKGSKACESEILIYRDLSLRQLARIKSDESANKKESFLDINETGISLGYNANLSESSVRRELMRIEKVHSSFAVLSQEARNTAEFQRLNAMIKFLSHHQNRHKDWKVLIFSREWTKKIRQSIVNDFENLVESMEFSMKEVLSSCQADRLETAEMPETDQDAGAANQDDKSEMADSTDSFGVISFDETVVSSSKLRGKKKREEQAEKEEKLKMSVHEREVDLILDEVQAIIQSADMREEPIAEGLIDAFRFYSYEKQSKKANLTSQEQDQLMGSMETELVTQNQLVLAHNKMIDQRWKIFFEAGGLRLKRLEWYSIGNVVFQFMWPRMDPMFYNMLAKSFDQNGNINFTKAVFRQVETMQTVEDRVRKLRDACDTEPSLVSDGDGGNGDTDSAEDADVSDDQSESASSGTTTVDAGSIASGMTDSSLKIIPDKLKIVQIGCCVNKVSFSGSEILGSIDIPEDGLVSEEMSLEFFCCMLPILLTIDKKCMDRILEFSNCIISSVKLKLADPDKSINIASFLKLTEWTVECIFDLSKLSSRYSWSGHNRKLLRTLNDRGLVDIEFTSNLKSKSKQLKTSSVMQEKFIKEISLVDEGVEWELPRVLEFCQTINDEFVKRIKSY